MKRNYQTPEVEYILLELEEKITLDLGDGSNPWAQALIEDTLREEEEEKAAAQQK